MASPQLENKLSKLNEKISATFEKVIEKVEIKDLPAIIKALAQVNSETERAVYVEKLAKKFKIDRRSILRDIKNNSSTPEMKKKTSFMSLTPPIEIVEVIRTEKGLRYCLPDFEMKDSLEIDGILYTVPHQTNLVYLPTERFLQVGIDEDDSSLFDEVTRFIYDQLDLSEGLGYKILALWILHTWLIDKFNCSPIIHFLGAYATGKSRGGDVLSLLAKRGISTVNMTGASIFRVNELYQPTFIIDEAKLTGKDRDRDILELLNARFQRGRKVIRINPDKSGLDSVLEFDVFGATVLCGLDELPETPRSRSIIFTMEQNTRPVAESLDIKKAEILRDKLCAFRARHIETKMPKAERFVKDGRLADAIEPLHQILKLAKPEIAPDFIKYFDLVEKDRREEAFDSLDAEILKALLGCRDKVEQCKVLVSHIAESLNEGKTESERISLRTIGRVLTRLKFKKTRTTGGFHARFWDEKRIERLCKKYGLSDVSDVSDISDIKTEGTENILTSLEVIR